MSSEWEQMSWNSYKNVVQKCNTINLIWWEREKKYIKLNFSSSWIKTCCYFYETLNHMMWLIDHVIAMKRENYIYMNTSNYRIFIVLCIHHNNFIATINNIIIIISCSNYFSSFINLFVVILLCEYSIL